MTVVCDCGEGLYDDEHYSSCYECFLERRSDYVDCIFCGRWHSPRFATCFRCRREGGDEREEAGRHLRWEILGRDDYTCQQCGYRGHDVEVDHVVPCRAGGSARPWNLQVLCRDCNRAKSDSWYSGCRWEKTRKRLLEAYFMTLRAFLDEDDRRALAEDVWLWRVQNVADPRWPESLPHPTRQGAIR